MVVVVEKVFSLPSSPSLSPLTSQPLTLSPLTLTSHTQPLTTLTSPCIVMLAYARGIGVITYRRLMKMAIMKNNSSNARRRNV